MNQPIKDLGAHPEVHIEAVRIPWPRDPRYLIGDDGTIVGPSGRLLRTRVGGHGYQQLLTGRGRTSLVHQVVCETFHGERPVGMQVAHNNGNRTDNRAINLRWATPLENQKDIARHGRTPRGERHSQHELNDDAIRDIRKSTATNKVLAQRYGVDRSTISYARRGKTWTHVH